MFTYDQSVRMQTAMAFSPLRVQLGTHNLCQAVIGINTEETQILQGYELYQNYPNPFNPSTKIGFTLPAENNVKIVIYNLIGQKVAELVTSKFSAGDHSIDFNAANLSSGIYLYKIEAGSFTSVKKMQLLK
jgi:hypothetical protein